VGVLGVGEWVLVGRWTCWSGGWCIHVSVCVEGDGVSVSVRPAHGLCACAFDCSHRRRSCAVLLSNAVRSERLGEHAFRTCVHNPLA
jgi:hypothetical protein